MKRRADNEPGFVLHTWPYKETSLIVEVLTRRHGRLGILARGARRPRSALRGLLLAFQPLRLSWSGSSDLGTLTAVEWSGGEAALSGTGLMCGFYLNELLLRLLPREDPHEALVDAYADALARLAAGEPKAPVLRGFERRLLAELGYAPVLDREAGGGTMIEPGKRYAYQPDRGPVESKGGNGEMVVRGSTLLDIARDDYRTLETREEALRLMRALIAERLGGQALHTRAVLAELKVL
ncbi:MAG: DNA repair protein RecO [Betaproteobacteria bacterium]